MTAYGRSLRVAIRLNRLADHGMLHQMDQGSVICRRLARCRLIAGFILLATAACGVSFAADKEAKTTAAPPPAAAKPADDKTERPAVDLGEGRFISVHLPLSASDVDHTKNAIDRALEQL